MAAKLKKGDRVHVIAGRDKGKTGEITRVFPAERRAIVGGLNQSVRHRREAQGKPGGRIAQESPIHLSNLMLADPKDGAPTRVGFRLETVDGKNRKVRIAKRSGEAADG
jgi:large subunit ribosomal protein L24